MIQAREQVVAGIDSAKYTNITSDEKEFKEEAICPILCEGDAIGAVVFLNKDEKKKFGELEQKVAMSAAGFLGRQMEQ